MGKEEKYEKKEHSKFLRMGSKCVKASGKYTDESFDGQVKCVVFVVSMETWPTEYNLKMSFLLSLHKIRSLDFPINLHIAYYN